MRTQIKVNGVWVDGSPAINEWFREEVLTSNTDDKAISVWQERRNTPEPLPTPIRIISTGAMQRRFTIPEEVFIASDAAATVIKSRLLNASYCDLDFQDTIDGITYICGVLLAGGVITDADSHVVYLLRDGEEHEKP